MHLQLADITEQFHLASARLDRLVAETPAALWGRRPGPKAWSAAECVAHLNLTARAYEPLLRAALDQARTLRDPAPRHYRRSLGGFFLSAIIGPLPAIGRRRFFKVPTAPSFIPTTTASRDEIVAEFHALQKVQIALVEEADELPLHKVRVQSPFSASLTYDVYSALLILPRHQHRHLQQAEFARSS